MLTPPALDLRSSQEPRASTGHTLASNSGARLLELLLVGGSTPLLFLLAWLLRASTGLDAAEVVVGGLFFYAAYVINDPHFAVTYVLFYRQWRARAFGDAFGPGQRRRYLVAGVVVPLGLSVWGLSSLVLRSAVGLGAMFQLMFLLVGWHYVKQGFGVLSVLAARRGVQFERAERRALLAHCYAAWAYAWASPADLGTRTEQKGLVYATLAQPRWLEPLTEALFFASAVPLTWLLVRKFRRDAGRSLLAPVLVFLCSLWLWTVYSSIDPLVRYAIPALHSLQYMYMVWLLQRNEAREREGAPWFESTVGARLVLLGLTALLLGFVLFHLAPSSLDMLLTPHRAQRLPLGPTPWLAATFAFVNIHHYFMDTVIWRRDNPLTRYLRTSDSPSSSAERSP